MKKLITLVCLFSSALFAKDVHLQKTLKSLKKNVQEFVNLDEKEQRELFEKCKIASEKVWQDVGEQTDVIKAKIVATTIKTIEYVQKGYAVDEAAALARYTIESATHLLA